MVLSDVHSQVPLLLGAVRTQRALEHRLLTPAFHLLVPPERRLPPVSLAAVATCELRLAAVARSHDLAAYHAELSHRTAVVAAPRSRLLYRVP